LKVLLADDDAVSRKLLQRMLERSGFDVVCVDNGQDAADCLLAADGPRLAILDWVMPVKDGPRVCREVRACDLNPYVYLILLTSRDSSGDVVAGLEAGADDYLTKPCNPEEMRARVRAGQRILELQDKLIHDAHHDSLTELPNRAFLSERLAESVRTANQQPDYRFAVLFIDIDRFKMINDTFGHLSGDKLMIGVAQRLLEAVRTEDAIFRLKTPRRPNRGLFDVVARIGGDEFVILLDDIIDIENGIRVAQRIQAALEPAFLICGEEVVVTASVGISINDGDPIDATGILQRADAAMYNAKVLGKARYEISGPVVPTGGAQRFKLEKDLRKAVENNEFVVHYQPIIALPDCRISGFEALVRWQHPELGLIQPAGFIGAAEDTGLILPLGVWILREACRQIQEWNCELASDAPLTVCVNFSPKQFRQEDLVRHVQGALEDSGLEPACLQLEVTENLTMEDAAGALVILQELRQLGVALSLDDFGTGYSSLSYLNQLPIQTLKIDRSFISDLGKRRESRGIVQTIISLGHNLGMQVVAEGVESEAQLKLLKRLRCDLAQGYLFSRPVDAKGAAAMFLARRLSTSFQLGGATAA
jgi:predicted signal transduction protein with EAL and GGDEF domain